MRVFPVRSGSWPSHMLSLKSIVEGATCLNKLSLVVVSRWKSTKKTGKKNNTKKAGKEEHARSNFNCLVPPVLPRLSLAPKELDHEEPGLEQLSPEQQALVKLILTGRNVFYTGAAGTGKSLVLRTAVKRLRQLGRRVEVVAPTGRAALAVNGITTWSYAGWTPSAHAHPLNSLRKWAIREENVHRLARTDVLVIDEISMVENHHLERLGEIIKEARGHANWKLGWEHVRNIRQSAFGGCQIIASGDFFQLPPVLPFQHCIECGSPLLKELRPGETMHRCPSGHGNWPNSYKWAFQSDVWDNADFVHVELKQVYRQAGDPRFIEILNRVRSGTLTYDDIMVLTDPNRKTIDLTNAVRLYPTRAEVARYNNDKLLTLKTPPHDFFALDTFYWQELIHPHLKKYGKRQSDGTLASLKDHRYEPFLRLKVGMPVILLKNISISKGMVNGSQGVIVDFQPLDNGDLFSRREKSTYISRIAENELVKWPKLSKQPIKALPVVRFDNGITEVIYPDCSEHELSNVALSTETDLNPFTYDPNTMLGRSDPSVICRTQIPLTAGWAMSIHKVQGMTLGKVIVDLTRAFEEGQVYVALSRARSLEGLKIEGDPRGLLVRIEGNQDVREFYSENFGNGVA